LPTLPAEEIEVRALELLKTNRGCSLPCWWGITPGISTTDETQVSFEPFFGAVYGESGFESSKAGGYYFAPLSSGLRIGIDVLAKENIISLVYIGTEMDKDIYYPIYDSPLYQGIMSAYTLEAILTKYGKPDQILIRSFSALTAINNPTQILLYYPKEGIVAQYFSQNLPEQQNQAIISRTCPPQSHISLRLFNPNFPMSLQDILIIDDSFSKYKDISEASNMNIDTFFQTYRQYDESALGSGCPKYLETSWDLWPDEYSNP
jgi:hypothetical protein